MYLARMNVDPDFDYSKPETDTRLLFVHRKLADGDLYFVDNRKDQRRNVDASFRVTGKVPELWHAETGTTEPVSYNIADGRTTVPLQLEPWGTVFVVFREPAKTTSRTCRNVDGDTDCHAGRAVEASASSRIAARRRL